MPKLKLKRVQMPSHALFASSCVLIAAFCTSALGADDPKPSKEYVQTADCKDWDRLYKFCGGTKAIVDLAEEEAKKSGKDLLIILGRDTCKWSRGLYGTLLNSGVMEKVRERFHIVPLASRHPVFRSKEEMAQDKNDDTKNVPVRMVGNQSAQTFIDSLGVGKIKGVPALIIKRRGKWSLVDTGALEDNWQYVLAYDGKDYDMEAPSYDFVKLYKALLAN